MRSPALSIVAWQKPSTKPANKTPPIDRILSSRIIKNARFLSIGSAEELDMNARELKEVAEAIPKLYSLIQQKIFGTKVLMRETGLSQETIYRIYNGDPIRLDTAVKLMKAMRRIRDLIP